MIIIKRKFCCGTTARNKNIPCSCYSKSVFWVSFSDWSPEWNVWGWPCCVNWANESSSDSDFMCVICLLFWIGTTAAAAGPAALREPVGLRRVEQCVLIVPPSCQLKSLCEVMWCRKIDVCKVCLHCCCPLNVLICQELALDAAVKCAAGGLLLARQTLWFAQSQW